MKLSILATALAIAQGVVSQAPSFNITAISAANNASRFECWQLSSPPVSGRGAVNFALGNFTNSFVGIIPANTTSGTISNAATVQYSLIMSGLVYITTPNSGLPDWQNSAYFSPGKTGWLIAADLKEIAAKGHITAFPSADQTVIAQFPVANNQPPAHKVLHAGPCMSTDLQGL